MATGDGIMVDKFLSQDLLRALDTFIAEQHPGISRFDALRLAFHDWATRHGYLDTQLDEAEVFPRRHQVGVSRADRHTAGEMLDQFIHVHRSPNGKAR